MLSGACAASSRDALVMDPPRQWLLVAVAAPVSWMDALKSGQAEESQTNMSALAWMRAHTPERVSTSGVMVMKGKRLSGVASGLVTTW